MSLDSVAELPPAPASNDLPLNKQIGKDLSTPNKDDTNHRDCKQNLNSENCLPKFQIVDNLHNLQKIENRQKQLEPLTSEILKSREKALKNQALRASGQLPEGSPSEIRPDDIADVNKPAKPQERHPEVYDASGLETARKRANDEGKKLFIEVYGERCGACRGQEETMKDGGVQNLLKNAIVVKINGDRNPDMLAQFKVSFYPTNEIYTPGQSQPLRYARQMSRQELLDALK
ncbi:MAG TPA: protein disulfide isomerase family protein [Drouetiella sp.]|jgi:Thioredoxin